MEATHAGTQIIGTRLGTLAASLIFAVLMGFSALVRIPLPYTPVPLTLQTFVLLTGAGLLGRWGAIQMMSFYLLLGIFGAPFFAGGSGFTHLIGATGGYLIGFAIAAAFIGFLDRKHLSLYRQMALYLGGAIVIYVPGLLQLKLITQAQWQDVIFMGFIPFIIGDLFKAVGACLGVRWTRWIMS